MTWLLGISLALQLATAGCALRLIGLTGRRSAWVLIASAITLMAVRRGVTLYQVWAGEEVQGSYAAECVALAISCLMLCGVVLIGTTFKEQRQRHRESLALQAERAREEREVLERQRLESLGLMAGGIAHDFNNLLTVILGYASLGRQEGPEEAEVREMFSNIESAANRASGLARQLLAYAGDASQTMECRDLREVVEGMRDLLHASLPGGARLEVSASTAPLPVRADYVQLEQVILNIVLNAAEALGGREGRIVVSTSAFEVTEAWLALARQPTACELGPAARIVIEDSGPGIDETGLQRIFDPFYSTKGAGRGLGLSAVLGIVRCHGGALAVISGKGRGARFEIVFPRAEEERQEVPGEVPARQVVREGMRALVVDDEDPIRAFVARALRRAGVVVETARDGAEGLELIERLGAKLDVLLVDRTMPGMTGDEVVDRLVEMRADVPIVMMSGYIDPSRISRTASRAIGAFLAKPFTATELEAAIERALVTRASSVDG